MTREEAKELLTHMMMSYDPKDQYGDYDDPEPYEQAIDMAIEALSQPIVCKDYRIDDDHIYCSPKVADRVVEALSAKAEQTIRHIENNTKESDLVYRPSVEAKGANLINRHEATEVIREECMKCNNLINADLLGRILSLPTSQQTDCTEFIMWLIEVVLDDEHWELNAVGYGEIIARELKKLGLLEVKDGYYVQTPSAEAKPTVIRSKTLLTTKDFKEWAKRVREGNPNVIVIPCDAEVVSDEAVEVVRCRDCWHWDKTPHTYCNFHDIKSAETDYCSWGERREDGEV